MTHREGSNSDDGCAAMLGGKRSMLRRSMDAVPWTARFGAMVIILYVIVAALAPAIAPYGERQIVGAAYLPPGGGFLLGTDPLGRDMAWKDVNAGAYLKLTPNIRVGGTVGLGDRLAQPQKVTPQDIAPRVHLETAFKF